MVPVNLEVNGLSAESTMSNLSEAGMAIWSIANLSSRINLRFSFELPFGGRIEGKGEVTWVNADGLSGVRFNILMIKLIPASPTGSPCATPSQVPDGR